MKAERKVRVMDKDFEQVYRDYFPSVYRYLLSITKNADMAEEKKFRASYDGNLTSFGLPAQVRFCILLSLGTK